MFFICGCYVFSVYKVTDTAKETKDKIADVGANATNNNYESDRTFEEGGPGTEIGRKDHPLTEYRERKSQL